MGILEFKIKQYLLAILITVILLASGCHNSKPRLRVGAFFGSPTGMSFPDPQQLGPHSYTYHPGEKLGMVYTCRGGFIDLAHVRELPASLP